MNVVSFNCLSKCMRDPVYSFTNILRGKGKWWKENRVFLLHSCLIQRIYIYVCVYIYMKSESEVAQSCLTLCDPMDTRLLRPWDFLGKSTGVGCHFLLQGSSWPRDGTWVSCIIDRCFTMWATREVIYISEPLKSYSVKPPSSIPNKNRILGAGDPDIKKAFLVVDIHPPEIQLAALEVKSQA